jgi:N-acetyl-anhydromuramyl-L-alanine amidase AmpD
MTERSYDRIFIPSENITKGATILPKLLVVHCIGLPLEDVIEGLTQSIREETKGLGVSSHYFIPQCTGSELKERGIIAQTFPLSFPNAVPVIQFVDESQRALHAGISYWKEANRLPGCQSGLNSCSIGIEFHAPGYREQGKSPALFVPYSLAQLETGAHLMKDIMERWKIDSNNILAHSDIAPYFPAPCTTQMPRVKTDPGPLFPWKFFHERNIGHLPPLSQLNLPSPEDPFEPRKFEPYVRMRLHEIGYNIPLNQNKTLPWGDHERHVVNAYKMHFMQEVYVHTTPRAADFGLIDSQLVQSLKIHGYFNDKF